MPANVIAFAPRRGGKTALQWHTLLLEAKAARLPIVCVACERPHERPPQFGKCPCGCYAFGVLRVPVGDGPQQLRLDVHAGEQ